MEEQLDYQALYNQAQQEIANHEHTIRQLVVQLRKMSEGGNNEEDAKKGAKKKVN
mgnify:FL=1|tara:strand:- start:227 stop:391 length:165 start_codon:yes stop_codon:yes gene_type:complete